MDKIRLEKPKLSPKARKEAFRKFSALDTKLQRKCFFDSIHPKYLYWDKIKHRVPPKGLTPQEAWIAARDMRSLFSRDTFLHQESGKPFTFFSLPDSDKWHHKIDTAIGGGIFAPYSTLSDQNRQRFLSSGLIEEAIASSQLEGANTSRKAAKKMILEKREPTNKSERMIINNYKAMRLIEDDFKDKELSEDLLLELHHVLTDQDPDMPKADRGRFRLDKDEIVVVDQGKQMIAHITPNESFMRKELLRLIGYANDQNIDTFIHPIIKAIFLHFWVGYLHPFTDGNGRMARALFYWYLLRKNYWGIAYLPISTVIKNSATQYGHAYLYTEQDGGDITYFYDYHIRKIIQAIEDFDQYIKRKVSENKEIDKRVSKDAIFNDRQKQLLHYLLESGHSSYTTMGTHSSIYSVSRVTAHKDLVALESSGYLRSQKAGRQRRYYLTDKLG
jgi:Fic family protein